MRPEDLSKLFEDAVARIKPKDSNHKAKLDKALEKIRQANEEFARDMQSIQDQLADSERKSEAARSESQKRAEDNRAFQEFVISQSNEQADLIERIAAKWPK